jgi:hypothetical protein
MIHKDKIQFMNATSIKWFTENTLLIRWWSIDRGSFSHVKSELLLRFYANAGVCLLFVVEGAQTWRTVCVKCEQEEVLVLPSSFNQFGCWEKRVCAAPSTTFCFAENSPISALSDCHEQTPGALNSRPWPASRPEPSSVCYKHESIGCGVRPLCFGVWIWRGVILARSFPKFPESFQMNFKDQVEW